MSYPARRFGSTELPEVWQGTNAAHPIVGQRTNALRDAVLLWRLDSRDQTCSNSVWARCGHEISAREATASRTSLELGRSCGRDRRRSGDLTLFRLVQSHHYLNRLEGEQAPTCLWITPYFSISTVDSVARVPRKRRHEAICGSSANMAPGRHRKD